ncbi:MAG: hypothetical protein H7A32_01025 [Deltaproteobacteria bacterium]|nr:hypothetical protein [Deltaproteobacteria bacterium]
MAIGWLEAAGNAVASFFSNFELSCNVSNDQEESNEGSEKTDSASKERNRSSYNLSRPAPPVWQKSYDGSAYVRQGRPSPPALSPSYQCVMSENQYVNARGQKYRICEEVVKK